MKRHIAEKWYNALKSGKYAQVQGELSGTYFDEKEYEYKEGFCCLGVLCDLYKGKDLENVKKSLLVDGMPIDTIYKWSGLDKEYAEQLAEYNDDGRSFKQIAQYIKQKYLKNYLL